MKRSIRQRYRGFGCKDGNGMSRSLQDNTRFPYICPIRTISSDVQELNAATFTLIMIWFLSVPNAATTTLIAKIELIFRIIPAAGLQTFHITTSS